MSDREAMLQRIRRALAAEENRAAPEFIRSYRREAAMPREAIVAQFAERVAEYRASVQRTAESELRSAIECACAARAVRSLVTPPHLPDTWLPRDVQILSDDLERRLSNQQLDAADGVLTGCALGIAQTGTIVLDGGPKQGRRALSLLPDYHLCVIWESQIVGLVPEAIAWLEEDAAGRPPRPLTFIAGPSATSDIELSRVEGVHGPRRLEVLLVSA